MCVRVRDMCVCQVVVHTVKNIILSEQTWDKQRTAEEIPTYIFVMVSVDGVYSTILCEDLYGGRHDHRDSYCDSRSHKETKSFLSL